MPHAEEQVPHSFGNPVKRPIGAARRPNVLPGTRRLVGTLIRVHENGYGFIQIHGDVGQGEYYININSMRDRSAWVAGQVLSFLPGEPREGKATPAYDAIALKDSNGVPGDRS